MQIQLLLTHTYFPFRYFEQEDEDAEGGGGGGSGGGSSLAYIPAPGSPSWDLANKKGSDSEEDPLDAFMAGLDVSISIHVMVKVISWLI